MSNGRGHYPAPITTILKAQDEGRASLASGEPCPYSAESPQQAFLRKQWLQGRAVARVELRDSLGMYDRGFLDAPQAASKE